MTDYCSLNIIEYHFYKFVILSVNDTNKRKNALINMSCIQSFYINICKREDGKKGSHKIFLMHLIVPYFSIFSNEATSPFIREELKPLCSISFNPTIVHPLGVVTLSISYSGC